MALVKRIQLDGNFLIVPNETARASEDRISNGALGLLVNIMSYSEDWELHKTELYKRYAKDGRTSVKNDWKELTESNYIVEYRYRSGKKWEYVYYVRLLPFSEAEKSEILDTARSEHSEIWDVDFVHHNMDSPKSTATKEELKKEELTKENNNNTYINNIDDDKRTPPSEGSAVHNEENINMVISLFREQTKDEITDRSFKSVVRKVIDKYNQGKVVNFRDYLATSLANKIEALELRRIKEGAKSALAESKRIRASEKSEAYIKKVERLESDSDYVRRVPFYNWLEE
ncbi:hypothetical protein LCM23_06685 [Cytobacillus kochii]|uniref:hypothetical protein n=1 Tax=Cytobacillus kochii TaxID=859143 RepID=UPI001CD499B6|nr:hypothetical protein [Cytobacillus kochii]MCA1025773.1 hypothetical protein [Cytobacillus kochii]